MATLTNPAPTNFSLEGWDLRTPVQPIYDLNNKARCGVPTFHTLDCWHWPVIHQRCG